MLLVTIAALRADHSSAFGYPRATTSISRAPQEQGLDLDVLANGGVLFARAFAPAPEAQSSLASLHSSRSPIDTGLAAGERSLRAELPTLAELMARGGYRSAAFAAPVSELEAVGLARGFERFEEHEEPARALDAARDFVRSTLASGERFFLWLHLARPSPPFDCEPLRDAYHDPAAGALAEERDRYDAELARTTAELSIFLAELAALEVGLLDRTLVAWAGASGVDLDGKGAAPLGDELLHVPLVLHHPPSLTGRRVLSEVVELVDLLPTLADWLGLPTPPGAQGRSLLPLVDSYVRRPFERRPALALGAGQASARGERWRLVVELGGSEPGSGGVLRLGPGRYLERAPGWTQERPSPAPPPEVALELEAALDDWLGETRP